MLSTQYRLRLEEICRKIVNKEEVPLADMIWANKLAKANTTAKTWLNRARREVLNPGDDFFNDLNLGSPDPTEHKQKFDGAEDIMDWFRHERCDDWRQRD
jgi:hypothetical protein|tara:strand:+ start:138 stop:437 length:300 start_codon:yes stop_codon:yes gene_type:complete